jgi:N-acetylmuramoyl-L-alanine amidase
LEKNKVFLWVLITLIFCFPSFPRAEEEIILVKGKYVDFDDLKKKAEVLSFKLETPTMHGTIIGNTGEVLRFQVDAPFYYHRHLVERVSRPVKYWKGKLFLPPDFVEAIFVYLIDNEVSYRFTSSSLFLNIYGNFQIHPEPIDLDTIIIDPGHGGTQPGAPSVYGDDEKTYNLEVAKTLGIYLSKKFPNVNIQFTRETDETVDLNERAKLANTNLKVTKNIIFVSLHCNAAIARPDLARGFEIYYLDQSYKLEAEREKTIISQRLIDIKRPPVIQRIQSGMLSTLVQRRSILLANSVEEKLGEVIGSRIISRGVKKANFRVLRGSIMPAILVEMGFISHPEDARLIADKNMQIKIAQGIVEGIKEYVKQKD